MISAWPAESLGEALEALARASGLLARQIAAPIPPATLPEHRELQGTWIEAAAASMGLETEAAEPSCADLGQYLRAAPPALLRLSNGTFLAIVNRGKILAPDHSIHAVALSELESAITEHLSKPLLAEVDLVLQKAMVPKRRCSRARQAILRERLREERAALCWNLRMPPGASAWTIARRAGLPGRIALLAVAHAAEYLLWIVSWWMVGQGALTGRFDRGWLTGWVLLLATMIPLRALTAWLQGTIALTAGGLLKERLLVGALRMNPDEVRQQGAGELLGRVIESEALESLALSGGFMALMACMELAIAAAVLAAGAGGTLHVALLVVWFAATLSLGWRYYRANRTWTGHRLDMTHHLVERMVGHRTRMAQEIRSRWHEGEDQALAQYLTVAARMDSSAVWLTALASRGWLVVGLLGLAPAFVSGRSSPTGLAIAVGGLLLAWRALKGLTSGLGNLAGAAIAWKIVAPLFRAASLPQPHGSPDLAVRVDHNPAEAILEAQDLVFRYQGRAEAVLRGCNLRIAAGDRLVLDGPSGGGKSTLGSLLSGWREPDSGMVLAGGLDRRTLGSNRWRQVVACAPQFHENHVLCGPFAFNLLMGRRGPLGEADLREAEEICRELGLSSLLERMPGGLMQMVGETGWQLSHGERSRLFIARALLQRAEAIVLDESFAALDPENLQLAMRCVSKRARAALVIAHR